MIGCNNYWNFEESSYFSLTSPLSFFNNIFSQLKVYKLIKIGWVNLESRRISKDNKLMFDRDKIHRKSTHNINPLSCKLMEDGHNAMRQGDNDLAMQKFKAALEIDKNNYSARLMLADRYIHLSKCQLAKKEIWKVVHMVSEWNDNSLIYTLNCSIMRLVSRDDYKELIRVKQYLENKHRKDKIKKLINVLDTDLCLMKQQNKLYKALERDLKDMIKISRENGVAIILQTYPHELPVNNIIREISKKYNIPLVDNEIIFMDKIKYRDIKDFFVCDGHCNENGYKLIADTTYDILVKKEILPRNKTGEKNDR